MKATAIPFFILLLLTACSDGLTQLERIQKRNNLRVAMIATPPIYFPDDSVIQGYGYEILASYANSIDVEMEITLASTIKEISKLIKQGKVHIGITASSPDVPDNQIQNVANYYKTKWHVIGNRNNKLPKKIEDIKPSNLVVANGSRPALVMSNLKKEHPDLYWLELPDANTRQVLEQVNLNNFKLSIIDDDVYTYYRYLYPETMIAFTLPNQHFSSWYIQRNDEDSSLSDSITSFMNSYKASNELEKKHHTYFRHLSVFNYIDSLYFLRRIVITLPRYADYFKTAAINNHFDERFLAAISYQESHWDKKARSHTGVRGLMMLTQETAKRVGVKDRLDPEDSIRGGAKYLNILKESLPERIQEPDRSWMSLAAYNVGLGHLEDARILTAKLGDNPDLWIDVEKHLPKLSQKEWYKKTKYGYARGHEPVAFVRKIRRYYDILRLYQQEILLEKLDKPIDLNKLNIQSSVF